jgi:hypothetical protein
MIGKLALFCHRWLGVALCVLFLMWFPSGIVMMYWDFPGVTAQDRLDRSPALDDSSIRLSPAEGYARLDVAQPPAEVRLNTFDGRPVYRFRSGRRERLVYADTGDEQDEVSSEMIGRIATAWNGQPAATAKVESVEQPDQWTVEGGLRNLRPLWKYSWRNGEQLYISGLSGEVVQYTTTQSRFWAWLGAIPHWIYFTPLRTHQAQWSQVVIWSSGIGVVAALLGIAIGIWRYSPRKRYRHAGVATSIPYRGQKRWHTILGLIFGTGAATWAFSGMLSMDPFPTKTRGNARRDSRGGDIERVLHGIFQLDAFAAKRPSAALAQLADFNARELELTSFAGEPVYVAASRGGDTRIVPVHGESAAGFGADRVIDAIRRGIEPENVVDLRVIDEYDAYYLDRRHQRPLPVVLVQLNDTRYYVDPKTARVAGSYASPAWVSRWLYHGLHSLDFPWLYKYRPL